MTQHRALTAAFARLAIVAALATVLLWRGSKGVAGFDSTYAVAWGHELVAGQTHLSLPEAASTPHPLGLILGSLSAALHLPGRTVFVLLAAVAWAASVFVYSVLAARLADAFLVAPVARRRWTNEIRANKSRSGDPSRARSGAASTWQAKAPASLAPATTTISAETKGMGLGPLSQWSTAAWMAAATTSIIIVCSPHIALLGKTGALDVVFTLCIGAAALAIAGGHCSAGYLLLTVGSLERPEGWLMLVFVVLVEVAQRRVLIQNVRALATKSTPRTRAAVDTQGAGEISNLADAPHRQWWRPLLWLLVTPILWLTTGLLFGDPLAALTVTQSNASDFKDPTGLGTAIRTLPAGLASGPGWAAVAIGLVGLVGLVWALVVTATALRANLVPAARRSVPDAGIPVIVLGFLLADVVMFVATGAIGATPIARYLVCGQLLLAALAGSLVACLWSLVSVRHPHGLRFRFLAVVAAVAVLAGAVHQARSYSELNRVVATQSHVGGALTGLLGHLDRDDMTGCRQVRTPALPQIPVIATTGSRSLADVNGLDHPSSRGYVIYPRNLVAALDAGYGPNPGLTSSFAIPAGYRPAYQNAYWAAFSSC